MISKWLSIHYLRAIAALAVVLHHLPKYLSDHGVKPSLIFEGGASGVDVFFVISGFVMYHSAAHLNGRAAGIDFIVKRIIRVVPIYWIFTLSLFLIAIISPSVFKSLIVNNELLLKSLFFIPYFDARGLMRPIISQGWTLNFEMLFYTTLSLFIFFRFQNAAMKCVFFLITASTLIFFSIGSEQKNFTYLFSPIVIEFCMGVLLAYFIKKGLISRFSKLNASVIAGILILISAFMYSVADTKSLWSVGFTRLWEWGLPAFFLVSGLVVYETKNRISNINIINILGDASYIIYLSHGLLFSVVWKSGVHFLSSPTIQLVFMFVLPILFGVLLHFVMEKPVTKYLSSLWKSKFSTSRVSP